VGVDTVKFVLELGGRTNKELRDTLTTRHTDGVGLKAQTEASNEKES